MVTAEGRLPSYGLPKGERQLSRIGVSQTQPEHGAGDFGKVPTAEISLSRAETSNYLDCTTVVPPSFKTTRQIWAALYF